MGFEMEGFNPKDLSTIGGIVTISLLHSFIPTHWLPFSIVGRAQKWTLSRTLLVTAFGAVLHVISTSLLGIAAITMATTIAGRPRSLPQPSHGEDGSGWTYSCTSIISLCNNASCFPCCWQLLIYDGASYHCAAVQGHNIAYHLAVSCVSSCSKIFQDRVSACGMSRICLRHSLQDKSCTNVLAPIGGVLNIVSTVTVMLSLVALSFYGASQLKFHWVERYDKLIVGSVLCLVGILTFVFHDHDGEEHSVVENVARKLIV